MSPPAGFRRSEFEASADLVRRESAKGLWVMGGVIVLGFPALYAISWLVPMLSPWGFGAAVLALLAVGIGSIFAFNSRASRLMRGLGLLCPVCKLELVGARRRNEPDAAKRVLESGTCPGCATQLLDPAEVRPVPRASLRALLLPVLGVVALLTAGLVVSAYLGSGGLTATRVQVCTQRYAGARSAADSSTVDAVRPTGRSTVSCGELQRDGQLDPGRQTLALPSLGEALTTFLFVGGCLALVALVAWLRQSR